MDAKDVIIRDLVETLKWYASEVPHRNRWGGFSDNDSTPVAIDRGFRAKAALDRVANKSPNQGKEVPDGYKKEWSVTWEFLPNIANSEWEPFRLQCPSEFDADEAILNRSQATSRRNFRKQFRIISIGEWQDIALPKELWR